MKINSFHIGPPLNLRSQYTRQSIPQRDHALSHRNSHGINLTELLKLCRLELSFKWRGLSRTDAW
jgi:hypothetical protein